MEVFDRVLDADDHLRRLGVDAVDHGGLRRRLAGPGGSGHEHQAVGLARQVRGDQRQVQRLHRGDEHGDAAQRRFDGSALHVHVDAEAVHSFRRQGEIELLFRLEFPDLLLAQRLIDQLLELLARQSG